MMRRDRATSIRAAGIIQKPPVDQLRFTARHSAASPLDTGGDGAVYLRTVL